MLVAGFGPSVMVPADKAMACCDQQRRSVRGAAALRPRVAQGADRNHAGRRSGARLGREWGRCFARRPHRVCRPGRQYRRLGRRRGHRLRGSADHARADRLPHASGLRRQSGSRVRDAPLRRHLRGDCAGRRRHRLDRTGDTGGLRSGTRADRPAPARYADRGRVDHDRDQVRLRPRSRNRAAHAARCASACARARHPGSRPPSSAPMPCLPKRRATRIGTSSLSAPRCCLPSRPKG